jgi:hypothetical protein
MIDRIKLDNPQEPQSSIARIIIEGMASGIRIPSWQAEILEIGTINTKWIPEQNSIGWHHILFGRIPISLTTTISQTLQDQGIASWLISGEKWSQRLIQIIWDTFLQLWQNRNNIIYETGNGKAMDRRKERLIAKVDRCYQHMDQLPLADRNQIFSRDKKILMMEDPRFIAAWLKMAERIIRVNKKEQKFRRQESVLMENYFK